MSGLGFRVIWRVVTYTILVIPSTETPLSTMQLLRTPCHGEYVADQSGCSWARAG